MFVEQLCTTCKLYLDGKAKADVHGVQRLQYTDDLVNAIEIGNENSAMVPHIPQELLDAVIPQEKPISFVDITSQEAGLPPATGVRKLFSNSVGRN